MPGRLGRRHQGNQPPWPALWCLNQPTLSRQGAAWRIQPAQFLSAAADTALAQRGQDGKARQPRRFRDRQNEFQM
jgi:hypothetical protein